MKLHTKYSIKVPRDVLIIYYPEKQTITVTGPVATKSLKLQVKIFSKMVEKTAVIFVSPTAFSKISNIKNRRVQGTAYAKIKHLFLETSLILYQKLRIIGIGYRANFIDSIDANLLSLKLGYSHPIYLKTNKQLTIFNAKLTKLIIYGSSYELITNVSAFIRKIKEPDCYKGKGIRYLDEIVQLKKGKKT